MNKRKITRLISLAARRQMTVFTRNFSQYGVGGGSYVMLVQIVENPGVTQSVHSQNISLEKATAGKALKQLEKAGLIIRRPDKADRRRIILKVTKDGMDVYEQVISFAATYREAAFAGIAQAEQELLEKLLMKFTENQLAFLEQGPESKR